MSYPVLLTYSSTSKAFRFRSVYRTPPGYEEPFHWLEAGWENRETIILLHGLLAHSMAYRKVVPHLAKDYRLIIPDLPAHGRDRTYRSEIVSPQVDTLTNWLAELLELVEAETVHLVGHSLGALTSFMGARYGGLAGVESLILVSPGIRIGVPGWAHRIFRLMPLRLARVGASSLGVRIYEPIQWRKSRMTNLEIDAYVKPFRQPERLRFMVDMGVDLVRNPDRLEGADRVAHPTLIIWGGRDHLLSVETGQLLQRKIPDSRLEVFDEIGHCPMEDEPKRFARLVDRFVRQQSSSGSD